MGKNKKEIERYFKLINKKKLIVSEGNIRKTATGGSELVKSMRMRIAEGLPPIREPLSTYWNEEEQMFEIWNGQKRFKAGLLIGIDLFPCFVYPEITSEEEARYYSIAHGIESEGVCHLDMAEAISNELDRVGSYQKLLDEFGWTKKKLTTVSKYRTIALSLSPRLKEIIKKDLADIQKTNPDFRHRKWSREVLYRLSQFSNQRKQEKVLKEYIRQAPKGRRAREFFDEKLEKEKQTRLMETGLKIKCSICGKQLSLIHKEPKDTHKLKEIKAEQKILTSDGLLVNVDV